jgi:hypothetical protein
MLDFYGQERGLILFRKHVVKYVRGLSHIGPVKQQLITCTHPEEFIALMTEYETEMADRFEPLEVSRPAPAYCGVGV